MWWSCWTRLTERLQPFQSAFPDNAWNTSATGAEAAGQVHPTAPAFASDVAPLAGMTAPLGLLSATWRLCLTLRDRRAQCCRQLGRVAERWLTGELAAHHRARALLFQSGQIGDGFGQRRGQVLG